MIIDQKGKDARKGLERNTSSAGPRIHETKCIDNQHIVNRKRVLREQRTTSRSMRWWTGTRNTNDMLKMIENEQVVGCNRLLL